jgi:SpoVK/Ycf46/Vps4 family AAA+-type ATPase
MTKFKKMDSAVDLNELAKRTRNFTGAEIESVVRSAQATSMNRLIQVGNVTTCTYMWQWIHFLHHTPLPPASKTKRCT